MQTDGYYNEDGYFPQNYSWGESWGKKDQQLNIKLSAEDMFALNEINEDFFYKEIPNSTLGRILIRRGIKYFKDLK